MCNLDVLEIPIIVVLVILIVYNLCMSVVSIVNLHRLSHGKVKVVTSLREYIRCSRRVPK